MYLQTTVTLTGDTAMHERAGDRLADMTEFNRLVGVLGMTAMHDKLEAQISNEQLRSPGLRQTLLSPGEPGRDAAGSIWELGTHSVMIGSNVPHAAMVNSGGTITPVSGKALAVPLTDRLKRDATWPRDLDPDRSKLSLIPSDKPGCIGVLIDEKGVLGLGAEPLYALYSSVTMKAKPYAHWTEADLDELQTMFVEFIND